MFDHADALQNDKTPVAPGSCHERVEATESIFSFYTICSYPVPFTNTGAFFPQSVCNQFLVIPLFQSTTNISSMDAKRKKS